LEYCSGHGGLVSRGIRVAEQRKHRWSAAGNSNAILELYYCVLECTLLFVSQPEIPLRNGKGRIHLDGPLQRLDRPVVFMSPEIIPSLVRTDSKVHWIQLQRAAARPERFLGSPHAHQIVRVPVVSGGRAGLVRGG